MSRRYDVVATIRYTKDGEERKQYIRCGTAFDGAKGINIKIDSLPAHSWDGWLSLYEPKERDGNKQPAKAQGSDDGDIPF